MNPTPSNSIYDQILQANNPNPRILTSGNQNLRVQPISPRQSPSRLSVDHHGNPILVSEHYYDYEIRDPQQIQETSGATLDAEGNLILPPIIKPPIYVDQHGRILNNNLPQYSPRHGSPRATQDYSSPRRQTWGYNNPEEEYKISDNHVPASTRFSPGREYISPPRISN